MTALTVRTSHGTFRGATVAAVVAEQWGAQAILRPLQYEPTSWHAPWYAADVYLRLWNHQAGGFHYQHRVASVLWPHTDQANTDAWRAGTWTVPAGYSPAELTAGPRRGKR